MSIRKRLYYLLALIFVVIMAGSIGYYIIFDGEPEFLDCLYMTVVSLTTVGYGEVIEVTGNDTAQIFTMVLITFGMGVILYGISSLTALFLEGELSGFLRIKRIHELTVSQSSRFNQKEIRECGLKERFGLLVLGAKDNLNEIEFNPPPTRLLATGTTLIVMGAVEEIARAREAF